MIINDGVTWAKNLTNPSPGCNHGFKNKKQQDNFRHFSVLYIGGKITNPKNDKNIYKVFNNVQYRLLDNKENFSHVVNMALGKEANCSFAEAADALGVSKETLEQLKTSGLV